MFFGGKNKPQNPVFSPKKEKNEPNTRKANGTYHTRIAQSKGLNAGSWRLIRGRHQIQEGALPVNASYSLGDFSLRFLSLEIR